jgi:hypothetical protein
MSKPTYQPVLVLRNLVLTKEEATLCRVALAALVGYAPDLLSDEGRAVLQRCIRKTHALIAQFPAEMKP